MTVNCWLCNRDFERTDENRVDSSNDYQYFRFIGYRPVCPDCLNNSTNFIRCNDCNSNVYIPSSIRINATFDDAFSVCDDCVDNYTRCDECGNYYSAEHIGLSRGSVHYCTNCSSHYVACHECGYVMNADYARRDSQGNAYCDDCWNERHNHLRRYGYKPYDDEPVFWTTAEDAPDNKLFFGIEQETDSGSDRQDYVEELFNYSQDSKLFVMKEDSSLDNGVEIVSYPCSLNYFMKAYPFESIMNTARKYDYVSHDSGNCGFHIHVSRDGLGETRTEQELTIAKIMFLFDRFWDNIVKFSRRRNTRWCNKPDAEIKIDDVPNVLHEKVNKNAYDHCRAVNLQHSNTVEFRIFRGTLLPQTAIASIQFLYVLVNWCMTHSLIECQNITWDELVASDYPELNAYLCNRGLKTGYIASTNDEYDYEDGQQLRYSGDDEEVNN